MLVHYCKLKLSTQNEYTFFATILLKFCEHFECHFVSVLRALWVSFCECFASTLSVILLMFCEHFECNFVSILWALWVSFCECFASTLSVILWVFCEHFECHFASVLRALWVSFCECFPARNQRANFPLKIYNSRKNLYFVLTSEILFRKWYL